MVSSTNTWKVNHVFKVDQSIPPCSEEYDLTSFREKKRDVLSHSEVHSYLLSLNSVDCIFKTFCCITTLLFLSQAEIEHPVSSSKQQPADAMKQNETENKSDDAVCKIDTANE